MEQNEKLLKIGHLTVRRPVIQGGMGVGISLSSLAGAVAKAGGVGIISTAQIGFRRPEFLRDPLGANLHAIGEEMKKAREIAGRGVIGFNIMVATRGYAEYVKAAVRAGADVIISGAGLPIDLPRYVAEAEEEAAAAQTLSDTKVFSAAQTVSSVQTGSVTKANSASRRTMLAPIVSSVKSALVICRMWDRKYRTAPDFVVIEGPCAGGHLGFSREQLTEYGADTPDVSATYRQERYDDEIQGIIQTVREFANKYKKEIPVISAGGIFDRTDVLHHLALGADGVQVATRFVTTEECDAPMAYKQAYIDAKKEDIEIVKSPVGMPGRAIKNAFLRSVSEGPLPIGRCFACLEHCDPAKIPYCITKALIHAAEGDIDRALLFCGSNAYRCDRIETVPEVMRELCGEG